MYSSNMGDTAHTGLSCDPRFETGAAVTNCINSSIGEIIAEISHTIEDNHVLKYKNIPVEYTSKSERKSSNLL